MENMSKYNFPEDGYYGEYGGRFIPEVLIKPVLELEKKYEEIKNDESFKEEFDYYLKKYVGRETPLYFAKNLTEYAGGAKIYLKREDLNHTGAHKINNAIGQALITIKMGKKKLIAETGAGQHGVATATAAALFGLECKVFMGTEDILRQKLNVFRMKMLGAEVIEASSGGGTLKDAVNEALRYWVECAEDTHYCMGSVTGPHPFPEIVRDLQSVIGRETKKEILEVEGRLPDGIVACVGGGSNAMGIFYPFIEDESVRLYGVEAGGISSKKNAATLHYGKEGVLHGAKQFLMQDENGQVTEPYSISAGLDYPGIGPEHCNLFKSKRAEYSVITDDEAVEGFRILTKLEGIIPAIESSHAVSQAIKIAGKMKKEGILVICLSGRGDKDVERLSELMEEENEK